MFMYRAYGPKRNMYLAGGACAHLMQANYISTISCTHQIMLSIMSNSSMTSGVIVDCRSNLIINKRPLGLGSGGSSDPPFLQRMLYFSIKIDINGTKATLHF